MNKLKHVVMTLAIAPALLVGAADRAEARRGGGVAAGIVGAVIGGVILHELYRHHRPYYRYDRYYYPPNYYYGYSGPRYWHCDYRYGWRYCH